eukprot:354491_1
MVIEGCDEYAPNDRSAIYIAFASFFLWWAIHLLLETYCNMGPVIRRTISLQEMQEHVDSANKRQRKKQARDDHIVHIIDNIDLFDTKKKQVSTPTLNAGASGTPVPKGDSFDINNINTKSTSHVKDKSSNVFLKLTKSLDDENQYRIRQSAAFLFTKVIFRIILLFLSVIALMAYPTFLVDHFWRLDGCTTYLRWLQYAAALIASEYSWECAMLAPYASVSSAIYIHHWFTILAGVNIIFGLYSPLATNYGIMHIAMNITAPLCGAFRFQYASTMPNATRNLAKIATMWMSFLIIMSWITSIIIVSRAFTLGFDNHHVPLWSIIMYLITMIGWGYDDFYCIQTYWEWGHEKYEDANFDMNKLAKLATGRVSNVKTVHDLRRHLSDVMEEPKKR